MGADGDRVADPGALRARPPAGPLGGPVVRRDDSAGIHRNPGRAGGVGGGRGFRPVRRPRGSLRRGPRRRIYAHAGRVWFEGGPGATARLAAAGPPGGAEPGVGVDERGDGQPGHLRHRPFRSAAAGAGPTLVGACAAGRGRHVRAVWGAAGFGGRRSQTAAGLFDDREHGPDHAGARCGNTFRGYRSLRAGVDRRRRSDAAHDCARGV
ncbi:hypothetical protein NCGM2209_0484 [Mycobacterium tuberculosis NCGM2209]|nr:hypothetical protein NCGM2209_0484 [Mycobacterium tuberculosis NCGM2209]